MMADVKGDLEQAADGAERIGMTMRGLDGLANSFARSLNGGLRAAVVEGRTLDVVMRQIVASLSARVLTQALSPLTGGLVDAVGGLLGRGLGAAAGPPPVVPFAAGGVVSRPAYFPMADGRTGLMGEAGAEAILPLARTSDGALGVRAGSAAAVNVTFNVTASDAASFRRSEAQVTAMLARAVGRGRRGL